MNCISYIFKVYVSIWFPFVLVILIILLGIFTSTFFLRYLEDKYVSLAIYNRVASSINYPIDVFHPEKVKNSKKENLLRFFIICVFLLVNIVIPFSLLVLISSLNVFSLGAIYPVNTQLMVHGTIIILLSVFLVTFYQSFTVINSTNFRNSFQKFIIIVSILLVSLTFTCGFWVGLTLLGGKFDSSHIRFDMQIFRELYASMMNELNSASHSFTEVSTIIWGYFLTFVAPIILVFVNYMMDLDKSIKSRAYNLIAFQKIKDDIARISKEAEEQKNRKLILDSYNKSFRDKTLENLRKDMNKLVMIGLKKISKKR